MISIWCLKCEPAPLKPPADMVFEGCFEAERGVTAKVCKCKPLKKIINTNQSLLGWFSNTQDLGFDQVGWPDQIFGVNQ